MESSETLELGIEEQRVNEFVDKMILGNLERFSKPFILLLGKAIGRAGGNEEFKKDLSDGVRIDSGSVEALFKDRILRGTTLEEARSIKEDLIEIHY